MSEFFRLVYESDKESALLAVIGAVRDGLDHELAFSVDPNSLLQVPGAPFAYWIDNDIRRLFSSLPFLESGARRVALGLSTKNDARFVRCWWEVNSEFIGRRKKWVRYANGGRFSRFYCDYVGVVLGYDDFKELRHYISHKFPYLKGNTGWILHDENDYEQPAVAWPLRTHSFSPHFLPAEFVFSARTYAACMPKEDIPKYLGLMSSSSCDYLLKVSLGRAGHPEFVTNVVRALPVPSLNDAGNKLSFIARRAWHLSRIEDTTSEVSNNFLLPDPLRLRVGEIDLLSAKQEISSLQAEIDTITADLYCISKMQVQDLPDLETGDQSDEAPESADEENLESFDILDSSSSLFSWVVGVAFGRFDIRLATSERELPPEPEPFDPLPAKSPGMLPDGDAPFHANYGILVDDIGHPHDLPHLIDSVLDRVSMEVEVDSRAWLRREFFPMHLKQYSKSRRKAPIYWPLSTASGGYTLWLYYPALTDQTLFVAANDFVGTKLERQVEPALRVLRQKAGRSREEERELEELQTLHDELRDLRAELLRLAPAWKPNHDDGVQIAAAPLWRLFRHRPWQTLLRETWEKLEEGAYDWAHLAMVYWPDRVREKCRTDKSLAIAHDLEHLYEPPPEAPAKAKGGRGRKKKD